MQVDDVSCRGACLGEGLSVMGKAKDEVGAFALCCLELNAAAVFVYDD